MSKAEEYFDVKKAFGDQAGHLGQRQRAAWDNSRRQMGTPLGCSGDGGGSGGGGNAKACEKCEGVGHDQNRCPSIAATADTNYVERMKTAGEKDKLRRCGDCGGKDHWARHHGVAIATQKDQKPGGQGGSGNKQPKGDKPAKKESTDCLRWVHTGKCKFGDNCRFQHVVCKKATGKKEGKGSSKGGTQSRR